MSMLLHNAIPKAVGRALLATVALLFGGCGSTTSYRLGGVTAHTTSAITNNRQDPICGVWRVEAQGAQWRMAIAPAADSEWAFHGVLLEASSIMQPAFRAGEVMVKLRPSDQGGYEGLQLWKNPYGIRFGYSQAEFALTSRRTFIQLNHFNWISAIGKQWSGHLEEPAMEIRADGPKQDAPDAPEVPSRAYGTGFFITDDGWLVTNAHVVENAVAINAVTGGGVQRAKVVRVDEVNDLALLKINGKSIPLAVASSGSIRLGETVATIGFPNPELQGFAPKLAKGEIAGLAGVRDDPRTFQISAPIQPGNSGGALVDSQGRVVGVVVAKLSQRAALATSGSLAENVNYAIKSDRLLALMALVPEIGAGLKAPSTPGRAFEAVVQELESASAQIVVDR